MEAKPNKAKPTRDEFMATLVDVATVLVERKISRYRNHMITPGDVVNSAVLKCDDWYQTFDPAKSNSKTHLLRTAAALLP